MEWKNYTYEFEDLSVYLVRIDQKKALLDSLRPIPSITVANIKESLTLEWTYNSNSIEGNTLTLQETKMVISEGFTIKGKSLREHFEAINHQEAIEFIEELALPNYELSLRDILDVHSLVLNKIEKHYAGVLRTSGVRISGANFTPPNSLHVQEHLLELISWVNNKDGELHPIIKATIFHHRFVWIHPFFDGNGRTTRLIFNLILMRLGFPPAIILKNDRKKYYDALNKANKGDYSKLLLLVCQAAERSLTIYVSNLTNSFDSYQRIEDIVSEPGVLYSQEYVSLLARQGKIDAFKEGRSWYTSEAAIKDYIASRKRKRSLQ